MNNLTIRVIIALFAILALGSLTFGASQLLAREDCTQPGQIGTCPPYTEQSCNEDCFDLFMTPGGCINGCCTCAVR
ncbi:MAG: hypothetical protein ACREL7_02495 [Longimicrobiales bacterium]